MLNGLEMLWLVSDSHVFTTSMPFHYCTEFFRIILMRPINCKFTLKLPICKSANLLLLKHLAGLGCQADWD